MKRLALAIGRDRSDLPEHPGLARHASHGLAIFHQPAPDDSRAPGLETLRAYASTIAGLHDREAILPLRFGSLHDSEADLDDWLRVHSDAWRAGLDEVEGCDEMGLRILLDEPERQAVPLPAAHPPGERSGTSYMKSLKSRLDLADAAQAEADRWSGRLLESIAGTARRSVVEKPGPGRERLLSLTHLVPRASLDRFRECVAGLQAAAPGKILLTGPWPPYSFTGNPDTDL